MTTLVSVLSREHWLGSEGQLMVVTTISGVNGQMRGRQPYHGSYNFLSFRCRVSPLAPSVSVLMPTSPPSRSSAPCLRSGVGARGDEAGAPFDWTAAVSMTSTYPPESQSVYACKSPGRPSQQ
jgi:hypothetical protein